MVVNTQYQYKIQELADLNNDISNFLNSTTIGTIFLDFNLHVKNFTPLNVIMSTLQLLESENKNNGINPVRRVPEEDIIAEGEMKQQNNVEKIHIEFADIYNLK